MPQEKVRITAEKRAYVVAFYLDNRDVSQKGAVAACIGKGFAAPLAQWASDDAVRGIVCDIKNYTPDQLDAIWKERLAYAAHKPKSHPMMPAETKAQAIVEYLKNRGSTQRDIVLRYNNTSIHGANIRDWMQDHYVREIACRIGGYTPDELQVALREKLDVNSKRAKDLRRMPVPTLTFKRIGPY